MSPSAGNGRRCGRDPDRCCRGFRHSRVKLFLGGEFYCKLCGVIHNVQKHQYFMCFGDRTRFQSEDMVRAVKVLQRFYRFKKYRSLDFYNFWGRSLESKTINLFWSALSAFSAPCVKLRLVRRGQKDTSCEDPWWPRRQAHQWKFLMQ